VQFAIAIATLEEFVRCINAHDPKGIVSLCTADHIFIDSLGSQMSGLECLEQAWAGYFSLFPDYRIDVLAAASQNAVVLACGFASPLTHHRKGRGEFQLRGAPL
jgi:ketosteroid isomerase-like protein